MAKKNQLSQEEIRQRNLEQRFKEHMERIQRCPEPTYQFQAGDEVSIGNLVHPVIEEVLENGKVYKIRYSSIHNNYGNPYQEDGLERYAFWYELRPISKTTQSIVQNADIRLQFHPVSINSILNDYYHFGIDMNPEYQRGYVWETEDKEKLIESIFHNIDIGKFVFIHNDYSDEDLYQILDGKQRLNAIVEYYENRFSYDGKYFNDLSDGDKNFFLDFPVTKALVIKGTKKDIIRQFLMLNTAGKQMDKEHIDAVQKIYNELKE